jgi:putative Mn2+ efflux pump MntP
VAVALGCDAFSVAVGIGAGGVTGRRLFRLSWHFGLFQFLMPLIGVLLGHGVSLWIGRVGPWIAGGLLVIIGVKMLWDTAHNRALVTQGRPDPTRGWTLILLSVATSLDALVVGFSLGILGTGILLPAGIIGITALVMTAVGMLLGTGIARGFGNWAAGFGGVILILLGILFILR